MNIEQLRKELEKHYTEIVFYRAYDTCTKWELDGMIYYIPSNAPQHPLYYTMGKVIARHTPQANRKFNAWANAMERGHIINPKAYKKMTASQIEKLLN